MERAGKISGSVTAARLGGPLQGARLMTGSEYSDDSPRDWTDFQGNYTIRGVRPGKVTVTVHHSDYAPELKKVEVEVGKTTRLDVELRPGTILHGIVKSESGKPVADVEIEATFWRGARTLGLRALSDSDGEFVIINAPHDTFEVMVTTYAMGRLIRTVKAGGDEPIVFTVSDPPVQIESDGHVFLHVGELAPSVSLTTLDGKVIELGKLRDKTILVSFWASWCAPCLADLPHLRRVFEKFGERDDLVIIAVSLDTDEKALRDFLAKEKTGWHHVFGEAGGARVAADRFGVRAIPSVFIIDAYGRVQASNVRGEDLLRRIEQILQDESM
jgi:peroxiredoxin